MMDSKDKATLAKLTTKWEKAKAKQQEINAKELDLRQQINSLLAKHDLQSVKQNNSSNTAAMTFKRTTNYSIAKPSVITIKAAIDNDVTFEKLFTITYKIKPAAYNLLEEKSKIKKVIDQHIIIKDAPLSVSSKVIEEV